MVAVSVAALDEGLASALAFALAGIPCLAFLGWYLVKIRVEISNILTINFVENKKFLISNYRVFTLF